MEQSVSDRSSKFQLNEQRQYTLVTLPIELLVFIFSFVTSPRDKVKLRYISQRVRAAVETPSLWRIFTWPLFDFREVRSIQSVFELCGRHVKQLSFPDLVINGTVLLQHCSNVLRLSLPAVELTLRQLRTIIQTMKKLEYLDILWTSKKDIKCLLLMLTYPVYGVRIKELTVREQVKDSSFYEALSFLFNEWTALGLVPQTLNIVCDDYRDVFVKKWIHWNELISSFCSSRSRSQLANHIGHLNVYKCFNIVMGLFPIPPLFHVQIESLPSLNTSFVNAKTYGISGMDQDCLLLTNRTTGDGKVLHSAIIVAEGMHGIPMNIDKVEFVTRFSANCYDLFDSSRLEQLAFACPNLQQLNLRNNVNCLKSLQGLRAISTRCHKLEGLNIMGISVKEVESCGQLWKILVDLQLTYLAIDVCCLLFSKAESQNKQSIVSLHQKCAKMKSLEVCSSCDKCYETKQPLLLSNFPLLIHCITSGVDSVHISEKLKYWSCGNGSWSVGKCNLEQVCIIAPEVAFPNSFMNSLSAHGALVHVILILKFVTPTAIVALIENSPSLITLHVDIQTDVWWCISSDFMSKLKEKYSKRKLFLCGSFDVVNGRGKTSAEARALIVRYNMDFISLWACD